MIPADTLSIDQTLLASPLRIALEATCACDPTPGGLGRYAENISRAMAKLPGAEIYVLTRLHRWRHRESRLVIPGAHHAWWQSGIWPLHPWHMDVVHGLDQRAPRWHRAIRASTIHDILWELPICKEWGDFVTAGREHARLTGLIHNVDHFITLSQATKCDLVNQRGVDPERISVIRPGVEPIFCPRSATSHTPFTKRYGLHRPFILHVGLCDPRKNIARLVDGFSASGLWRDFDLVLIGRRGRGWPAVEKEINTLCMNDYVRSLDYIDSKHLPFLYSAAEALALPSLHEGFGLPILESMASGVPVVTSNRPGMTEAAGGHAILIDPKDPGDIASGLIAAIDMPRDKREEARFYALKHQWEDTARRHLALYRRIIDDRGFRLTNGLP